TSDRSTSILTRNSIADRAPSVACTSPNSAQSLAHERATVARRALLQERLGFRGEIPDDLPRRLDVVHDAARLADEKRHALQIALEGRRHRADGVAGPVLHLAGEHAASADERSLTGAPARRRATGCVPFLERLVPKRSVRRARPPLVVQLAVDGVGGGAVDHALLVDGMKPRLVARDEAGAQRDRLRTRGEGARDARPVADPAR